MIMYYLNPDDDMVNSPEYEAIVDHRTAALTDSRLIAHQDL
jgi:hypothetical protein